MNVVPPKSSNQEKELSSIAEQVSRRVAEESKMLDELEPADQEKNENDHEGSISFEILDQWSFSMDEEPGIEFAVQEPILHPWLSAGTVNMLHGSAGTGKTWLVLATALSTATGISFLPGWESATGPVKTLVIDGENVPISLRERKRLLVDGHDQLIHPDLLRNLVTVSNIHLSANGQPFIDLSKEHDRFILEDFILYNEFLIVILDNLSCLIPSINIKASEEYSPFNVWLINLKAKGVAVIFVHHDNKTKNFTGVNEMTFALNTRLHVNASGQGFNVEFAKFRDGAKPKTENYNIANVSGGVAITTGIKKGTVCQDIVSHLSSNHSAVDLESVKQYLTDIGHTPESIKKALTREQTKKKQAFKITNDSIILF